MAGPSSSTAMPPTALREQYGTKPPDITRKVTACIACRKQKIRCIMGKDSQPPCTRCKKRGLPCTVNKSLQMILESDADWKSAVERKLFALETGLGKVATHLSLPDLTANEDDEEEEEADEMDHELTRSRLSVMPDSTQTPPRTQNGSKTRLDHDAGPASFEMVMDPDSGPAAIPGSVVSPVAVSGPEQNRSSLDIVTRNIITRENAERYLDIYQNRLDHFLYRILDDQRTLQQIRTASPLLLAAISAVGALHMAASPDFERCYQEVVSIASAQTFSRKNTADDVRGLCIAAFWLSGISWTCIGTAVRIATEIGLHRSIFKALAGDRTHYLRTRLYYLVYVCDHHFSIAYGRPPLTREDDSTRASSQFLESEHAVEDDARLVSQVQIWTVGNQVYETFGVDVERPLNLSMIEPLRRLSIRLDAIRADWSERFSHNRYVGNYPRKGVGLHSHFLKLYLNSMAFRGIGSPGFRASEIALDIDELANSAVLSATAILRAVVADSEIQSYLNGLPTYFDVMIAFAVVFVLKVSTKYASAVRVDTSEIHSLVGKLVVVLKDVTSTMHPRHLLSSVARGAETLLEKCAPSGQGPVPSNAHVTMAQSTPFDTSLYSVSGVWGVDSTAFDNFFMGEFDFLSGQDMVSQLQP